MSDAPRRPRAVLMCHAESRLNREGIARWLGSFTDLVGMVIIDEQGRHTKTRVRKEVERIGWWRFLDVVAFRAYYGLVLDRRDSAWMTRTLDDIAARYPAIPATCEQLVTPDSNGPDVQAFLERRPISSA